MIIFQTEFLELIEVK